MNNINNILITREYIEELVFFFSKKRIQINNLGLFQKAFIHKSFWNYDTSNDAADSCCVLELPQQGHNERFEFLGDKVIDMIVTEFLFDKYPLKDEGFLTKLKSKIVKKESGLIRICFVVNSNTLPSGLVMKIL